MGRETLQPRRGVQRQDAPRGGAVEERNGKIRRAGGWGAPVSDEGSGYWIGASVIREYLEWVDGFGTEDAFFDRLREVSPAGDPEEAAAILAALHPAQTADWAKAVLEASGSDELCRKIVTVAAEKTALLAASVYRKSNFWSENSICIVESGGLFRNEFYERVFRSSLEDLLPARNYSFLRSDETPAEDGIRLARKLSLDPALAQSCD